MVSALMNPWLGRYPVFGPIVLQHRPEHLIDVFAGASRRTAKNAFLNGAKLPERAVGAAVLQQHARLEPMRAERPECERPHEPSGFEKGARAARRRRQRAFPFGRFKRRIEAPNLQRAGER